MGRDLINNQQKARILELALKSLDDDMLPAESQELEGYVSSSKALAAYYSTCIKMHLCMVELKASQDNLEEANDVALDHDFWQMMAVHEKMAPETEIVKEKAQAQRELIQKVVYAPREKRRLSLSSKIFLTMNAAAILFFLLFIKYAPPKGGIEVATLTDSIDAQWANADLAVDVNSGFRNADGIRHLSKGCIKVRFFEGAEVIIEGPAEFEFKSSNSMGLNSGRLYANVGGQVSGFTVDTPTSKIVDLGTQFGIKVDFDGTSDLHMFKGRAVISKNVPNGATVTREVAKGQALRVRSASKFIEKIPFEEKMFVRDMSSASHLIWRGESSELPKRTLNNGVSKGIYEMAFDGDAGTTDWSTVSNWQYDRIPYFDGTKGTIICIVGMDYCSSYPCTIDITNNTGSCYGVILGRDGNYEGTLNLNGTAFLNTKFSGALLEGGHLGTLNVNDSSTGQASAVYFSDTKMNLDSSGWFEFGSADWQLLGDTYIAVNEGTLIFSNGSTFSAYDGSLGYNPNFTGTIDVAGGKLRFEGDDTAEIAWHVKNGNIIAHGGQGSVNYYYDPNLDCTIVTAGQN